MGQSLSPREPLAMARRFDLNWPAQSEEEPDVHKLIGAEVSLYTGKVRAYLRYKGIAFEEVAARAEVYRDVIIPRTGVRFIPVLISDDDAGVVYRVSYR